MSLIESYKNIRKSIVAFASSYSPGIPGESPPLYPEIIGTGFIVRENGIIVTNDHVLKAFQNVYKPSNIDKTDLGVFALLYHSTDVGYYEIPLHIIGIGSIKEFNPGPFYFGPKKPDLAFVQVKAKGLPSIEIDSETEICEGLELATAGFPMGTDALTAPGYIHQMTPTLQKGIISSVLPYQCKNYHAFTINVMVQGGASGSPVFLPDNGKIVGVLYGSLNDVGITKSKELYRLPTNISYVVPAKFIQSLLNDIKTKPEIKAPSDALSIEDMLKSKKINDIVKEGRKYEVRQIQLFRDPIDK
jgi:S1-C subfamily serine protease